MTTINTIEDLARILQENPTWAEAMRSLILSRRLEELPEQFERFVEEQRAFNEEQKSLNEGQKVFNEEQRSFVEEQKAFNEEQRSFVEEQKAFNAEQKAFNERQRAFNSEQKAFNAEQREINQEFRQRFNRIEGRLGNLEGAQYERAVQAKILARALIELRFDRPYIALNQDGLTDPRLTAAISRAIRDGAVASGDCADLFEADIIISSENNLYAVVEVSLTADRDDIARAKSRAAILSQVTGGSVAPIVITSRLNPSQSAQAEAEEVSVFVVAYP